MQVAPTDINETWTDPIWKMNEKSKKVYCFVCCMSAESPLLISYPHFLYADPVYQDQVIGLEPNPEKHETEFLVEPVCVKFTWIYCTRRMKKIFIAEDVKSLILLLYIFRLFVCPPLRRTLERFSREPGDSNLTWSWDHCIMWKCLKTRRSWYSPYLTRRGYGMTYK